MLKKWEILPIKSDNIIDQILINRNIDLKNKKRFLDPDFVKDLPDPYKMLNIKQAVLRIDKAIKKKEKIAIYGDYDADGIPGSVLLYEALKKIGLKSIVFISKRQEGYGVKKVKLKRIISKKIKLIITVDLGTRDVDEINWAKKKGIEFIICDHHEVGKKQPDAILLNPKNPKCKYPFKELSGCGVAYKLVSALAKKYPKKIKEYDLKWWLELVAISTICDVVPLVDENRVIAKYGLIVLQKTKRIGLNEIFELSQIKKPQISTYNVGFQIGPRLNAPSRMEMANESFWLLATKKSNRAKKLASILEKANKDRQALLTKTINQANKQVVKNKIYKNKVILIAGKNWSSGIVGLVAGKLVEKFARPAIVLGKGDKLSKGSARSIDGFHIVQALEESKKFLTSYGGHSKAAGLTLENEHLEDLYSKILEIADVKLKDSDLKPKITIDSIIGLSKLNYRFYSKISKLEPYGLGNPKPIFISKNVEILDYRLVGADKKHLKTSFKDREGNYINGIGFDLSILTKNFKPSDLVDIAYNIDINEWNGERKVEIRLLDMEKAKI